MIADEAEVDAASCANRKQKRGKLARGSRDMTGGRRGESQGARDDDLVLTTDEHARSSISHGGSARRGRFGNVKRRLGCGACIFFACVIVHAHFPLCSVCRCERVLHIELVLNKISISLVAKGLRLTSCAYA